MKPYIIIEGPDHSGKSSIIQELKKVYSEVYFTEEPVKGPLRDLAKSSSVRACTRAMLMVTARSMLYETLVEKLSTSLYRGIISDRGFPSSLVYQVMMDGALNLAEFRALHRLITPPVLEHPVVIFLDIDLDTYVKRSSLVSSDDHYEGKSVEWVSSMLKAYRIVATNMGEHNTVISVDAKKPLDRVFNE